MVSSAYIFQLIWNVYSNNECEKRSFLAAAMVIVSELSIPADTSTVVLAVIRRNRR